MAAASNNNIRFGDKTFTVEAKKLSLDGVLRKSGEQLSSDIGKFVNLEELYLRSNKLVSIPKEIGNLTKLRILYLEDNELNRVPPEIGNLKNLKMLILKKNYLDSLPNEIQNLQSLELLSLSNNLFKTLPPFIGRLTNLQQLKLKDNLLSTVPSEIAALPNLRFLELTNNPIRSLPESFRDVINIDRVLRNSKPMVNNLDKRQMVKNSQYARAGLVPIRRKYGNNVGDTIGSFISGNIENNHKSYSLRELNDQQKFFLRNDHEGKGYYVDRRDWSAYDMGTIEKLDILIHDILIHNIEDKEYKNISLSM